MKAPISIALLTLTLTACTPPADVVPQEAITACQRADVQDVVGKEVRNMMLKSVSEGVFVAAFLGFDVGKAFEQAKVSFSEVGVDATTTPNSGPPFTQIVCGGAMQIDASSTRAGQDIVTLPRLRWSINFAQPTQDPTTAGFTIAVDPISIYEGMLVNGKPADNAEVGQAKPDPLPQAQQNSDSKMGPAEGAVAEAESARTEAEQAEAEAKKAMMEADKRAPSDEDLYAPHPN